MLDGAFPGTIGGLQIDEAAHAGVISKKEAAELREYHDKVRALLAVDDFAPDEIGRQKADPKPAAVAAAKKKPAAKKKTTSKKASKKKTRKKTGYSTDVDVLTTLSEKHELPALVLRYRTLSKLKSTYTDKLPEQVNPDTGRVHTSYHQAVAATGRLSSSDPNLQNIPVRTEEGRRIRQAFVASPGSVLLAADYSQIELRIMAHLSSDAGLLKAFAEEADVHRATAAEVFGIAPERVTADQRRSAKAINFGLIYGMSAFGLARQLGIERGAPVGVTVGRAGSERVSQRPSSQTMPAIETMQ